MGSLQLPNVTLPTGVIEKLKKIKTIQFTTITFVIVTAALDDNQSYCPIVLPEGGGPSSGAKSNRMNYHPETLYQ